MAAGKAKEAMQKVDTEYSVSQRAKEAARRTVGAAQQTSRDIGVSEKATGAATAAEKVCVRGWGWIGVRGGGGEAYRLVCVSCAAPLQCCSVGARRLNGLSGRDLWGVMPVSVGVL